ncbi:hypothetical protein CPLU01_13063 [Colletotrichum plurivorum]|uniref:Uncharacterized protein n=1 Tax=Colletotrichum plurivorum TaxID=2175906 RepID=A0A8H6N3W0_9PEZI|nr:hypothetical protein CPLU01_13063 [Colletotrichum plurivorum]
MLAVFVAAVVLGRRRMKKRQQAHRNRYSALVSEGGANTNRNTVVQHDGYGQGTFPGYAYDGGEGGYKYTAGYAGGPDMPPPAYTSHDPGAGSGGAADNGASNNGASTSGGGGATTTSS